jgi:hypothetical protein
MKQQKQQQRARPATIIQHNKRENFSTPVAGHPAGFDSY